MRSLDKYDVLTAQNICARFEEIGMFDCDRCHEPNEYYDDICY